LVSFFFDEIIVSLLMLVLLGRSEQMNDFWWGKDFSFIRKKSAQKFFYNIKTQNILSLC